MAISLRRGCRSFVNNREAELSEDEIKSRAERRLRDLVAIAQHEAATDETDAAIASLPSGENEPSIPATEEADPSELEAEIAEEPPESDDLPAESADRT